MTPIDKDLYCVKPPTLAEQFNGTGIKYWIFISLTSGYDETRGTKISTFFWYFCHKKLINKVPKTCFEEEIFNQVTRVCFKKRLNAATTV